MRAALCMWLLAAGCAAAGEDEFRNPGERVGTREEEFPMRCVRQKVLGHDCIVCGQGQEFFRDRSATLAMHCFEPQKGRQP